MPKFWLPLKNKSFLLFIAIITLAAGLRFYRINQIPYGFYWDEAAITYNAWGLAVWNRDEFGNKLPISFKSFGDYKAPLLIYLLGGIYKLTGLHPEYLRILIALSGIGSVVIIYFISPKKLRLPAVFFMSITPWAVNFSRFGVEATLALFLFLLGLLFLDKSKQTKYYFYPAAISFSLCLYAYHSAKIVVPLYLLAWAIVNRKTLIKQKSTIVIAAIYAIVLLFPLIKDTLYGQGFERGKSLIFFSNPTQLTQNLLSTLSLNFWIFGQDAIGLRHSVPGFGVLLKTVFILFLVGVISSTKKNKLLILWLLIGLLPSILSTDAPHAIRSLMALPPVILLAVSGYSILPKTIKPVAILLILIENILYLKAYYGPYAVASATTFQYGYKEAILAAEKIADANDKIIVTDYYGQPYIYTLLYRKLTPEEFKFGALANYEFHKIYWPNNEPNRIFVATPEEISSTDSSVKHIVSIPNTNIPVFVIVESKDND
jgi:hypothetical protein